MMGGPEMMGGPGMYAMMFWMPMGMLFFVVLLVGAIWLIMRWLNQKRMPMMPYISRPQDSYQQYELGYRPRQPLPETQLKDERRYQYPQPKQEHDQPQLKYPQEQDMPWQR
jgi:hypothetical protein